MESMYRDRSPEPVEYDPRQPDEFTAAEYGSQNDCSAPVARKRLNRCVQAGTCEVRRLKVREGKGQHYKSQKAYWLNLYRWKDAS